MGAAVQFGSEGSKCTHDNETIENRLGNCGNTVEISYERHRCFGDVVTGILA